MKQLSREEALAIIAQAKAACPDLTKDDGKMTVSRNKAGGVFIRHPSFKAISPKTGNLYTAGVNINDLKIAKELFLNPQILQAVQAFVKAEVLREEGKLAV